MRVLAIDTALGQCAACVFDARRSEPLAAETMPMERGHAEALLPLLDRVVSRVDGSFEAIDRVAVTVGPGSFTGLRVGISAARAIGFAIGIPVVGVTTLSALMAPLIADRQRRLVAAAIDARGERVYAQAVASSGQLIVSPSIMAARDLVRCLGSGSVILVGSGASMVAAHARPVGIDARIQPGPPVPDMAWVARLGAAADPGEALAKPLYIAAPDARPQDAARLPLL